MRKLQAPVQELYEEIVGAIVNPKVDILGTHLQELISINLDIAYQKGAVDALKRAMEDA